MKKRVVGLLLILEKHTLSIALWLIFDILIQRWSKWVTKSKQFVQTVHTMANQFFFWKPGILVHVRQKVRCDST